ncbi:hypothetical protein CBS101457_004426 [Exobasidium rhododendri]|nr:hypothetical protein CBS101457_004426 [Exobasidium rhododendri]
MKARPASIPVTTHSLQSHPPQFNDPAIISYTTEAKHNADVANLLPSTESSVLVSRMPAGLSLNKNEVGTSARPRNAAKAKGGKNVVVDLGVSSRTHTEDETEYEPARNGKKQQTKSKKKAQSRATALEANEPDLQEDFDFDKALRSFDKSKIWQEIRTSDTTDPMSLLVTHNRLNGSGESKYNGKNGQQKLGLHEPVLSPSPTASHASLPGVHDDEGDSYKTHNGTQRSSDDSESRAREEMQRLRGSALQRELDNSKLRDRIARLEARLQVLEALGGVELEMQSEEADGHKWKATIYESLTSHTEARKAGTNKVAKGSLIFLLRTYKEDASRLRYLGVEKDKSDAAVVEKLPPQYEKEMGLKIESASVFVRRIKEAVQL